MRLTCKLAPACLLFVLFCLLRPAAARAQEPDFSGTTDILNGQTHLLRSDDLAMAYALNASAAPYNNNLYTDFLLTNESQIAGQEFITTTSATTAPITSTVRVAAGRMFDLPDDVAAVLSIAGAAPQQPAAVQLAVTLHDRLANRSLPVAVATTPDHSFAPAAAVMADFTGDAFDDLAVSFTGAGGGLLAIVRAADAGSWAGGVVIGAAYTSSAAYASLAAADVDGDGRPELVAVTNGSPVTGAGGIMDVFAVDPTTLKLTLAATTNLGAAGLQNLLVSGDYDGNPADDEVAVAVSGTPSTRPALQLYDFPAKPPVGTLLDQVNVRDEPGTGIDLAGGPIHWFGAGGDAIVVSANNANTEGGGDYLLSVFTVTQNKLVLQSTYTDGPNMNMMSMALGRFDNKITGDSFNPDLQMAAVLESDIFGDFGYILAFYTFGSSGSGYKVTTTAGPFINLPVSPLFDLSLATGDLQGRSLRLGAPNKITINGHNSPSTMIGLPPMHLDWAVPSCSDPKYPNNCTTPQQVAILAKPASNYAQLNTQVKDSSQSSSKKTTSYSLATKESVESKVAYGIPDLASVSVEAKASAKQTYDKSVAATNSSYASVAFDASVRTGFADHIWFDNYRFNIWTYPVLGQAVCPAAKPNCSPVEQVPLHLQFSGPDKITAIDADGNGLEWYQPVWEPGNLFSYPWTEAQLEALLPRSTIVNRSDVWAADSSGSNASVTWSQGSGQSVSQGSSKAYSNDKSISVAANVSIEGFGISGKAGFDASTSSSTATLNTASTTHGSSTGFTIAKTAQGVADYVYAAQTYIMGQAPLTGTLQTLPVTATVQTSGPLRLAYWSNPYDSLLGGDWWATTYNLPDVALNHPQRWTWTTSPVQPNLMTFNHVVTSTSPFDQEFYLMRGLYITSQGAPDGPQLVTAPVTQTVLLQARVYNYSHVDMNAPNLAHKAAAVKVRFYGQLFESSSGDYPVGDSFLIGERDLAPIAGFASATTPGNVPNWSMAVQAFDPSAFVQTQKGEVYVRFWVVVWMEDGAGNLVPEMPGHGLTADPRQAAIATMGDVPIEPYSNNVGTFKQTFYVQDPGATTNATRASNSSNSSGSNAAPGQALTQVSAAGGPPTLTLAILQVVPPTPPLSVGPLGKHMVTTTIAGGATAEDAVQVLYYDGDPAHGGKLFDWELIPHIAAGSQYVNRVTYTPQSCGTHTIYVTAQLAAGEISRSTEIANTPCVMVLPIIGKNAP